MPYLQLTYILLLLSVFHRTTSDIDPRFPFRMNVVPAILLAPVTLLVPLDLHTPEDFFLRNSCWMSYWGAFLEAGGAICVPALPKSRGTSRR